MLSFKPSEVSTLEQEPPASAVNIQPAIDAAPPGVTHDYHTRAFNFKDMPCPPEDVAVCLSSPRPPPPLVEHTTDNGVV